MTYSVETYLQDPFTVYKAYCGLKTHFTSLKYDYKKYKQKLKVSYKQFLSRKDKMFFNYLATVLNESDNTPFFISQFIESPYYVGEILFDKKEALNRYSIWSNRVESMKENYIIDLHNIGLKGYTWKTILQYNKSVHPPLFQMVVRKEITPETYYFIHLLSNYITKTMEAYKNDVIYKEMNIKYLKYGSFINVKLENILKITPKELDKC